MNPRQFRTVVRAIHLVAAAITGVLVYVPAISADTARAVIAFVIIPLLGLSGVAIWQQAKLRKLFKGSSGAQQTTVGAARE